MVYGSRVEERAREAHKPQASSLALSLSPLALRALVPQPDWPEQERERDLKPATSPVPALEAPMVKRAGCQLLPAWIISLLRPPSQPACSPSKLSLSYARNTRCRSTDLSDYKARKPGLAFV